MTGFGKAKSAMPGATVCAKRDALFDSYDAALKMYSAAVAALTKAVGVVDADYYELLSRRTRDARIVMIEARERFRTHLEVHHC